MSKVSTNISIDENLKKEAIALFKEFGLDLSTAISLFLSQSVREQKIPFEIKMSIPNNKTKKALKEKVCDKELYKRYDSFDEIIKEIK